MKQFATFILVFSVCCSAAFSQSNQVVFSFDHKAGADPLVLNQTVFSIWNNKKVKLSRAEFYISEVEIQHADMTSTLLSDQYLLVNATTPLAEFMLGSWPVSEAHGVLMHLGVPQSVNHNDPAALPSTHPLSPQDPSMHWGWTAGYRFMAIEGKVDNNGDGEPETDFEFHNLGDALYKSLTLTGIKAAENGVLHLHFVIDYAQLFKNITMTGNIIQHGSGAKNIAMMENAATQNFLTMAVTSSTNHVESNSLNILASPNPADSKALLQYSLPTTDGISLQLTNNLGQIVRFITQLPAEGAIDLETAALPEGIYQYAFYKNNSLLARKQLVVQH